MAMRKCAGTLLVILMAVSIPLMAADTLGLSINGNETYAAEREISIELAYQGIETPTEMRVTVAGEEAWSEWFDYVEVLDLTLPAGDGLKSVKIETRYWVESKTTTDVYGGWHVVAGEDDIFLDMTPPVLTASLTPDASEYGWYNEPVSVVFHVSDGGSGVAEAPRNVRFNQEGEGQSIVVKAVDSAGNETELTVGDINIDLTLPAISSIVSPNVNDEGWYNEPVTVKFKTSDFLSGIAVAPSTVTLSQEGEGQSVAVITIDRAGNEAEIIIDGINIDMTSPVITVARTPVANANGWYNGPVAVTYNVTEKLSGIVSAPEDRLFSMTSDVTLFPKATDKAGNVVEFGSIAIHIDVDSPVVISHVSPGSSPDVWSAGPVTVTTDSSDGFSGVGSVEIVEGAHIFASDGGAQVFSALVTDLAGNQATTTVGSINIDNTLSTTTILLKESEGLVNASADGAVSDPIDLITKLDAYGEYDPSDISLAYAFQDSAGMPIEGLNVHATILKVGENSAPDELVSLLLCEYAPTGGFYYMTLPEALVSGQQYIVWFESSDQAYSFKTRIIGI